MNTGAGPSEHQVHVETEPGYYHAVCSCGWQEDTTWDESALRAAAEHAGISIDAVDYDG